MNFWHRLFRHRDEITNHIKDDADLVDAKRRLMMLDLKAKRRQALELDLKSRRPK